MFVSCTLADLSSGLEQLPLDLDSANFNLMYRGRIQDFWKGIICIKVGGFCFADFISFIPQRPNYFIFIGYLKTGGGGGGVMRTP